MRWYQGAALALTLCSVASGARAGGFDTPILYSARHQGIGGAAVGYVDDASALYHNPAGLSGIKGLGLTANLSPLFATLRSSPGGSVETPDDDGYYQTRQAEPIVGPAFLLGAGYRLSDWLVIGVGAYPLASASAEYKSTADDFSKPLCDADDPPPCREFAQKNFVDRARIVFIEASPGLSVNLPLGFSLGAGYRVTLGEFERQKGDEGVLQQADVSLSGVDASGFRVGGQWSGFDWLSLGVSYRHKITPDLEGDKGSVAGRDVTNVKTTFVIPSKLTGGGKLQFGDFAAALDVTYGFNSQMKRLVISGEESDGDTAKLNIPFLWKDSVTAQGGVEYTLIGHLPLRLGYAWDGQVASKHVPSAFGTPPTASHSFTGGLGWVAERWQVNMAGAFRTMNTAVTPGDVEGNECEQLCGKAGREYSLDLVGLYVDFSYDFDVASAF